MKKNLRNMANINKHKSLRFKLSFEKREIGCFLHVYYFFSHTLRPSITLNIFVVKTILLKIVPVFLPIQKSSFWTKILHRKCMAYLFQIWFSLQLTQFSLPGSIMDHGCSRLYLWGLNLSSRCNYSQLSALSTTIDAFD